MMLVRAEKRAIDADPLEVIQTNQLYFLMMFHTHVSRIEYLQEIIAFWPSEGITQLRRIHLRILEARTADYLKNRLIHWVKWGIWGLRDAMISKFGYPSSGQTIFVYSLRHFIQSEWPHLGSIWGVRSYVSNGCSQRGQFNSWFII